MSAAAVRMRAISRALAAFRVPRRRRMGSAAEEVSLEFVEFADPPECEVEELVELLPVEALPLGGPLDLDERAGLECDDVHVDLGADVLGVVEVEPGLPVDDPDAGCGDEFADRIALDLASFAQPFARVVEGDGGARDARGPGPAIGDEDVAVDEDGAFAEGFEVDRGSECTPDEALDLERPSPDASTFPARALVRRSREHRVLRGDPPGSGSLAPVGHAILDGRGAEDAGHARGDQAGSFGVGRGASFEPGNAEFVRRTIGSPSTFVHGVAPRMRSTMPVVDRPCRNGTTTTRPPAASTSARPTTSSGR